jgi:ribose transport system ATP-binding protein
VSAHEPILTIRNLTKAFPGVVALDHATLDLHRGEVLGLLGENGAGKSSMIKVLAGVYEPEGGEILVRGEAVTEFDPLVSRDMGISVIFQELNLVENLSVTENIFLGREIRKAPGLVHETEQRRQAQALLDETGLDVNPDTIVSELSLSQKQMVEVAKALSVDASIIIMDEPTSSLTSTEVERLFEIVEKLRKRNVAILFVSHRLDEVFQICDRVHILRDGQDVGTLVVAETSPEEIINRMVGREIGSLFVKDNAEIGETVLEAQEISSEAGIKNVSFSLKAGEILGFAGLIGAGRTELMRAIFGIDPLTHGSVWINGKKVEVRGPYDAIKNGLAFVTEDRKSLGLILGMNVRQNVTLVGLDRFHPNGLINDAREQEITAEYVSSLRIKTPSQQQKVINLSGGNQQKVVLSKWLSIKPRILILDEPTRGIDVAAKKEIHKIVSDLAQEGVGIILISSELPEILAMSDRIVVMHEGIKKAELPREGASQEKIMAAALS